jgi:alpha-amylase/alpha-mannosidase (GH57 family)
MYYDAEKDCIPAPFVRMHATRDYFEMFDVIQRYPNIHATAVVSPELLWQVQEIYVKRMEPFIKKNKTMRPKKADMDAAGFLARMKGKTDPWIDVALTPAEQLSEADKAVLYKNELNAFTMPQTRMNRFPELMKLYEKWRDAKGNPKFTVAELRLLKFFSVFAHFDTEFFERNVTLIQTGTRIKLSLDLRDLVYYRSDGHYYLKREITEQDCHRIVASAFHVMSSILPTIQKTQFIKKANAGQVEIAATSYADAILPLVINNGEAKNLDASVQMPKQYKHPEDAERLLQMGLGAYKFYLNETPNIYVPNRGAVSPELLPILKKTGFQWFTSTQNILEKTVGHDVTPTAPFAVDVQGSPMYAVFSNKTLNDRVAWMYRNYYAENSAEDFVDYLLSLAPRDDNKDVLVTLVLDDDEHWMFYQRDTDGKGLINSVYRKVNAMFKSRAIIATTISEYLEGNRERGIPAHSPNSFTSLKSLSSGTSVDGNYNAWIGDKFTAKAWDALVDARAKLTAQPDLTPENYANLQANPMNFFYAAVNPYWMQVFGQNTYVPLTVKPFEQHFKGLLTSALKKAGVSGDVAVSVPADPKHSTSAPKKRTRVTFVSKLVDREAITSVFIVGNRKELGNLEPNMVRMWDNGENGDEVYGNNVWTLVVDLEEGELIYKYTNSGGAGTWDGTEAFPDVWRRVKIEGDKMTFEDVFARFKK